jgi:hypothetical protein
MWLEPTCLLVVLCKSLSLGAQLPLCLRSSIVAEPDDSATSLCCVSTNHMDCPLAMPCYNTVHADTQIISMMRCNACVNSHTQFV